MLGGAGSPGGEDLLTVTIVRDEHGYGMKVSGDNPVYVQSVKEHGAAWRAGLRAGDRILRVDSVPVHQHTHQQVVHMIRANPTTVLTVQQNAARHKTPITAPQPVNPEKQRQLEAAKARTVRMMLDQELKYIRDLRQELSKVPDVRKQAQLESAELRCSKLQREIDSIITGQPPDCLPPGSPTLAPGTPVRPGFLSALPRSLSNLTGQSLRNLRQARLNKSQEAPPLVRRDSEEPTTCLDNAPPPLPPRAERNTTPPLNPLAKPKPTSSKRFPMHQSMPPYEQRLRSAHSLDGDLEGPQPNSIAMQMSYPLVNVPPPPLQTDNRSSVPVLHVRSRSSPEQLDTEIPPVPRPCVTDDKEAWERGTPPPGTPPPPYAHNTQPCADPQRAIISMEEDDSPSSDTSTYSGLFSNLRSVRESKARTAVLLNWLLGERRCACASLLLILTDGYRAASGVTTTTLRRWAYEIQSTFLIPNAVLQLNGVDENMANEIEHVLVNEYDKEELLRNVFRKARQKAKEELSQQLTEFQVKRKVGLASLYAPEDSVIEKCDVDKAQELIVVERLLCQRLSEAAARQSRSGPSAPDAPAALLAALLAAALCLHCRPASVAAAVGGSRASFLQRDKLYKQRVKQLAKQHPQPYVVRGHHLQLQALTSVGHCHHCDHVIWGLAPQAYVCTDCKLRVHRACAKSVEEGCCMDGEHHNNRISRFMERIHPNNQLNNQDTGDKKSRKTSNNSHFLNMERSFRKMEDEQPWDQTLTPASSQGEPRREGSAEEQTAPDADVDTSDTAAKETPDKDNNWRAPPTGRGVNRAESCRERDAPRRGKHRNASDPNRLTAHNNHDLEPGAATAPSGSSSSSSLSSRSNESNTVAAEQQVSWNKESIISSNWVIVEAPTDISAAETRRRNSSQSDWSEEEEPLAAQWADSLPSHVLESLQLSPRLRKRQEVIHELIVSEGSHVRWLKVLCRVFLRPLEAAPSLLPADELRALFPNLPDVRDWHASLHTQLRTLRNNSPGHVVPLGGLAETMLGTLGEASYAACLSRFCRGQRLALEALRERRRKNKELHQFLASREQLPLCGRLQLRDLLACVWQRLTKYRLLLESVLKTVNEGSDEDDEADVAKLRRALDEAKYMLNSVDTAIRAAENEHRLRTIQNKLEVRVERGSGAEWDELKRLDLTQHSLRLEGDLSLRHDSSKKIAMLALMFEEMLVLLQREGDKYVLKPIPQPSQHAALSPLIKWDKVLFRPNAAVRNTFFLMNINGVQMHELSANTNADYNTWVNYIQEAPLAKVELKQSITPSHQASRSTDDSGINVSRNPSDASEKSNLTAEDTEPERDRLSLERAESERDRTSAERTVECDKDRSMDDGEKEREEKCEKEPEAVEREEKHVPRRPTVGRISTHGAPTAALESTQAVTVRPPLAHSIAHTAETAYTYQERLRRLDEGIRAALAAKSAIVGRVLGVPAPQHAHLAELAVAEALGDVDIHRELRATRQSSRDSSDDDALLEPDMRQLLLAAHEQANQLTEAISKALTVNEAAVVAARARRGRCNNCRSSLVSQHSATGATLATATTPATATTTAAVASVVTPVASLVTPAVSRNSVADATELPTRLDDSDPVDQQVAASMCLLERALPEVPQTEGDAEEALESNSSAAILASRLSRLSCGLQASLSALLLALPADAHARRALRAELAARRDHADRLLAELRHQHAPDYQMTDEIYLLKPEAEQPIQDQPSNGG